MFAEHISGASFFLDWQKPLKSRNSSISNFILGKSEVTAPLNGPWPVPAAVQLSWEDKLLPETAAEEQRAHVPVRFSLRWSASVRFSLRWRASVRFSLRKRASVQFSLRRRTYCLDCRTGTQFDRGRAAESELLYPSGTSACRERYWISRHEAQVRGAASKAAMVHRTGRKKAKIGVNINGTWKWVKISKVNFSVTYIKFTASLFTKNCDSWCCLPREELSACGASQPKTNKKHLQSIVPVIRRLHRHKDNCLIYWNV